MPKARFIFEGLIPRKQYVIVVFKEDVGGTYRVRELRMPWSALLDEQVTTALDNVVRRHLIEIWSGVDIADPLF